MLPGTGAPTRELRSQDRDGPPGGGLLASLARQLVRLRRTVLLVTSLVAIAAGLLGAGLEKHLSNGGYTSDSFASVHADRVLADRFRAERPIWSWWSGRTATSPTAPPPTRDGHSSGASRSRPESSSPSRRGPPPIRPCARPTAARWPPDHGGRADRDHGARRHGDLGAGRPQAARCGTRPRRPGGRDDRARPAGPGGHAAPRPPELVGARAAAPAARPRRSEGRLTPDDTRSRLHRPTARTPAAPFQPPTAFPWRYASKTIRRTRGSAATSCRTTASPALASRARRRRPRGQGLRPGPGRRTRWTGRARRCAGPRPGPGS